MADIAKDLLLESKYFTIVFNGGQEIDCKLIQYGKYDVYVEVEEGKLIVPKHSIKYFKM